MGKVKTAAALLAAATSVAAHGHVPWVVVNGVAWQGYDVNSMPYQNSPPTVVGWSSSNVDNGFVEPVNFGTSDVICHRDSGNAKGYIPVNAGDYITFLWTVWPESHLGPVIEYLAPCNGRCDTVDKNSLEFFKIAEAGLLSSGEWAAGILMANNNTWTTQIPSNVAPGDYVLRHEIIALHGAANPNGAQDYPYCFNIRVSGSGSAQPAGTPGTELMKEDDAGIVFNIWGNSNSYPIPGPPLMAGGISEPVPQGPYTATAIAAPSLYDGSPVTSNPITTQPATTTAAPTTTLQTSTTTAQPGGTVPAYGQCGGNGYTGPTQCASGSVCNKINDYYSQCVPN